MTSSLFVPHSALEPEAVCRIISSLFSLSSPTSFFVSCSSYPFCHHFFLPRFFFFPPSGVGGHSVVHHPAVRVFLVHFVILAPCSFLLFCHATLLVGYRDASRLLLISFFFPFCVLFVCCLCIFSCRLCSPLSGFLSACRITLVGCGAVLLSLFLDPFSLCYSFISFCILRVCGFLSSLCRVTRCCCMAIVTHFRLLSALFRLTFCIISCLSAFCRVTRCCWLDSATASCRALD